MFCLTTDQHITSDNVEWRISREHAFGARGPGFDLTPKPRMAFYRKTLISLLSDNGLKNY